MRNNTKLAESCLVDKRKFSAVFIPNLCFNRMALVESELALSETKVNELSALLSQAQEDHAQLTKLHQTELRREREVAT